MLDFHVVYLNRVVDSRVVVARILPKLTGGLFSAAAADDDDEETVPLYEQGMGDPSEVILED